MKLGVIGCGKMSTALVSGAVERQAIQPQSLFLHSKTTQSAQDLATRTGGSVIDALESIYTESDVLLLGMKPQQMEPVLDRLSTFGKSPKLIVSIAAGVSLERLSQAGSGHRYCRVMPNTPSLVGEGASAYSFSKNASAEDRSFIDDFLNSVGLAVEVMENQMDAVTGLSGSGPAYIFTIIEALSDGGVLNGLPRDLATKLATQTVLGAAKMQQATQLHPGQLKDQVTSPGGTTINGVSILEKEGVRSALISAVTAATNRSKQL